MTEYLGTDENRVEWFLQCLRNATGELQEVKLHIDAATRWMESGLAGIKPEMFKKGPESGPEENGGGLT